MNLNNLEEVNFVDDDTESVKQNVITTYEGITGRSLAPADPERLFLEGLAAIIGQQKVLINQTGRQNLLAYAEKTNLDHLGALVETERLPEQPAKATIRFYRVEGEGDASVITILTGTRLSPDGKLFFKTDEAEDPIEIKVGETYVDVPATCDTSGAIGNNYLPGQIKKLVDPISFVSKIENVTTTTGGADIESDDSYRLRINNAPSRFSTAGPKEAYEYYAKSTHQEIEDVEVISPIDKPGTVNIYILLSNGRVPGLDGESDQVLTDVETVVNDEKIRPLTDYVKAKAPEVVNYSIDVDYYLKAIDKDNAAKITLDIEKAVDEYAMWQKTKMGRDINPDILVQKIITAGAKRVVVRQPEEWIELQPGQIAINTDTNLTNKGSEDE
ncbi:MAG: baseplate J/gp47 family protein [Deltaproteobacteria bacterium]|nr:baseplate J/gp47 family protein [Deltaproteobacteria bacterium]